MNFLSFSNSYLNNTYSTILEQVKKGNFTELDKLDNQNILTAVESGLLTSNVYLCDIINRIKENHPFPAAEKSNIYKSLTAMIMISETLRGKKFIDNYKDLLTKDIDINKLAEFTDETMQNSSLGLFSSSMLAANLLHSLQQNIDKTQIEKNFNDLLDEYKNTSITQANIDLHRINLEITNLNNKKSQTVNLRDKDNRHQIISNTFDQYDINPGLTNFVMMMNHQGHFYGATMTNPLTLAYGTKNSEGIAIAPEMQSNPDIKSSAINGDIVKIDNKTLLVSRQNFTDISADTINPIIDSSAISIIDITDQNQASLLQNQPLKIDYDYISFTKRGEFDLSSKMPAGKIEGDISMKNKIYSEYLIPKTIKAFLDRGIQLKEDLTNTGSNLHNELKIAQQIYPTLSRTHKDKFISTIHDTIYQSFLKCNEFTNINPGNKEKIKLRAADYALSIQIALETNDSKLLEKTTRGINTFIEHPQQKLNRSFNRKKTIDNFLEKKQFNKIFESNKSIFEKIANYVISKFPANTKKNIRHKVKNKPNIKR